METPDMQEEKSAAAQTAEPELTPAEESAVPAEVTEAVTENADTEPSAEVTEAAAENANTEPSAEVTEAATENADTEPSAEVTEAVTENADTEPSAEVTEAATENADTEPSAEVTEAAAEKTETPQKSAKDSGYTLRNFLGDALDLAESFFTAIFVVMLAFTYLICTAFVEGDSMVPTLSDGDRLLVSRIGRHYNTGDILILDSESAYTYNAEGKLTAAPGLGKRIVKRLIAQAGQELNIDFDEGIVYVDGKALDEPYTSTLTKRDNRAFTYPLTIPEGYVFVLGDNRHISKDSRHPEVGLIPEEKIIGRVLLRIMPLSKFGSVGESQQAESQRD